MSVFTYQSETIPIPDDIPLNIIEDTPKEMFGDILKIPLDNYAPTQVNRLKIFLENGDNDTYDQLDLELAGYIGYDAYIRRVLDEIGRNNRVDSDNIQYLLNFCQDYTKPIYAYLTELANSDKSFIEYSQQITNLNHPEPTNHLEQALAIIDQDKLLILAKEPWIHDH